MAFGKRLGIIGASSLGSPALINSATNRELTPVIITRSPSELRGRFPNIEMIRADLRHPESMLNALQTIDILHIDLSMDPITMPYDFVPERDGLSQLIDLIPFTTVRQIGYVTSLVNRVQKTKHIDWWIFDIKLSAVNMIKNASVPSIIFHSSPLMETIDQGPFLKGTTLFVPTSQQRGAYFLAGQDFGRQVVNAYSLDTTDSIDYMLQGPERLLPIVAAKKYAANRSDVDLIPTKIPFWPIELAGKFSRKFNYMAQLLAAYGAFEERFWAGPTWEKLGAPEVTIARYAQFASTILELDRNQI